MSADNWTICPKCKSKKESTAIEARLKAEKSYGKVTSDKFLSLINAITNKETETQEKTLREDYEISIDESGEFYVNYSASCSECDFKYKYDYVASIP